MGMRSSFLLHELTILTSGLGGVDYPQRINSREKGTADVYVSLDASADE
jgi:hypothetical protein